jgi:hypothetical protein
MTKITRPLMPHALVGAKKTKMADSCILGIDVVRRPIELIVSMGSPRDERISQIVDVSN